MVTLIFSAPMIKFVSCNIFYFFINFIYKIPCISIFSIYGYAPQFDADCKVVYDPEKSVFPTDRVPKFPVDTYTVVPDDMKIPEEEISWITFGKLIHKAYDYTIENKHVSLLNFIYMRTKIEFF